MKKFISCLFLSIFCISAHAQEGCDNCNCIPDTECPCMSMPECINQEGTCTPHAHCGCYETPCCDCNNCTACTTEDGDCSAPHGGCTLEP